jgi:hypothetical protein
MSTATESTTTGATQYLDFDQFVDYQLQKTRAGIRTADLLTALVVSALALLGYLFLFVVFDHWVVPGGFGYLARLLMLLGVLAGLGSWLAFKVILPARRRVTALYAAKELEHSQPGLKNNLLTLVDLQRAGRPVSPQIISTMQKRAARSLSETNVDEAVDRRPLLFSTYALCGLMAVMFAYVVFSPKKMSASIWRALLPASEVAAATRTRIERVTPGHATVLRGEQVTVEADLIGEVPTEIQLVYTTADLQFVDEPLAMRTVDDRLHRFRCVLAGERGRGLLQNVTYRVVAGDAVSEDFTLTVQQPPSATVDEVAYRFPDYMRLSNRTDPGGTIDAYEGAMATVRATVNMPVVSAVIQYGDDERFATKAEEYPLAVRDGTKLEGSVQLRFRADGTTPQFYRVQVKTASGATDPQPTPHPLRIRPDLPPKLVLHHPRGDQKLPANAIVPLAYRARDPDFLLHSVTLFYKRVGDEHARQFPLGHSPLNVPVVEETYRLPLQTLSVLIEPGTKIAYWIEARDNLEPFPGREPNVGRTPVQHFEIIDPVASTHAEEQFQEQQQQAQDRLDETRPAETDGATEAGDAPAGEEQPASESPRDDERPMPEPMPGEPSEPTPQNPLTPSSREPDATPNVGESNPPNGNAPMPTEPMPAEPGTSPIPEPPAPMDQTGQPQSSGGQKGTGGNAETQSGSGTGGTRGSPNGAAGENASNGGTKPGAAPNRGPGGANGSPPGGDRAQGPNNGTAPEQGGPAGTRPDGGTGPNGERPQSKPGGESRPAGTGGNENGQRDHASDETILRELAERLRPQPSQPQKSPDGGNSSAGTESQPKPNGTNGAGEGQGGAKPHGDQPQGDAPSGQPPTGDQPNGNPGQTPDGGGNQPSPDGASGAKPSTGSGGQKEPQAGEGSTSKGASPSRATPEQGTTGQNSGSQPGTERDPQGTGSGQPQQNSTGQGGPPMPSNTSAGTGATGREPMTDPSPSGTPGQPGTPEGTGQPSGAPPGQTKSADGGGAPAQSKPGEPGQSGTGAKPAEGSGPPMPGANGVSPGQPANPPPFGAQPPMGDNPPPAPNSGQPTQSPMPDQPSVNQPGGNQPGGNQPGGGQPGAGQPGGGQPGGGQPGGGQPGGGQPGGGQPGGGQPGGGQPGGGQPGGGQPGGGQPGGGQPGGGQPGGGQPGGGQPGGGQPGGGQPGGGQPGGGQPGGGGGGTGGGGPPGPGGGGGTASGVGSSGKAPTGFVAEDLRNLDDERRAADLVLKQLRDQLERGEVDDDLKRQLGVTDEDLQKFADRLEERLAAPGGDESPEARDRRRQFEELLRGIHYESQGAGKSAETGPQDAARGASGVRRPTPPEYRDQERALREKATGQRR